MADDTIGTPSLRDAVITGLRELGWPEPHGKDCSPNSPIFWQYGDAEVFWCPRHREISFESEDRIENGEIELGEASASRIIEAIDRLRWVIGLLPETELSKGVRQAMTETVSDPHLCGQLDDSFRGLVPLTPSKPKALPSYPFEPRKIGEF